MSTVQSPVQHSKATEVKAYGSLKQLVAEVSSVRERRTMNVLISHPLLFLYCLPYPKLREWCHPLLTWVFPPQAKIITHSCAERLVSLIALGSNMLTTKINHHMWQAFYFQGHLHSPVFTMFGYVERSTPTTSSTWDVPGPKLSEK